jgi:DNA-binding phage protein
MRTLALPDLLRGLILQRGWSVTAAGHAAGISPLAVDRWCKQQTSAATTWLRLIAGFRAQVVIVRGAEVWSVQVPTVASQARERERRTWRQRRFIHYLNAIATQNDKLKRAAREQRARTYIANEEARIVASIEDARRRMTTVLLAGEISGMRAVIQALARASNLSAEELSFSAGVGTDTTIQALNLSADGRLMPLRRLLAALDARLELHLPSGSRVVIARCDAAPEEPIARPSAASTKARTTRGNDGRHDGSASRSSLDRDEVLRLYDAGLPITQIASTAGISRQRVHAIAKSAGRTLRRAVVAEARSREAAEILA